MRIQDITDHISNSHIEDNRKVDPKVKLEVSIMIIIFQVQLPNFN
jgi:hypothetical protein